MLTFYPSIHYSKPQLQGCEPVLQCSEYQFIQFSFGKGLPKSTFSYALYGCLADCVDIGPAESTCFRYSVHIYHLFRNSDVHS